MGCGDSSDQRSDVKSIEELYAELKLQNLITMSFEQDLEEKIFKAVNVCRAVPQKFTIIVKQVKNNNPMAKNAAHTHLLLKTLQNLKRLPPVRMDEMAFRAVRQNNARVVGLNEQVPKIGGNVDEFITLGGGVGIAHEYTHYRYDYPTPEQFVALQMIMDFNRHKSTPILNRDVSAMGVSVMMHRTVMNVI